MNNAEATRVLSIIMHSFWCRLPLANKIFFFTKKDGVVTAKHGVVFYARLDLDIAKYHFKLGAVKENFKWSDK